MSPTVEECLNRFCCAEAVNSANLGALCTLLFVTRRVRRSGLPMDPAQLLSRRGGQVHGHHSQAVRAILAEHGLAWLRIGEAGRTNSANRARAGHYLALLNQLHDEENLDLQEIEQWWIDRLPRENRPRFHLRCLSGKSPGWMARDLIRQVSSTATSENRAALLSALLAVQVYVVLALAEEPSTGPETVTRSLPADLALGHGFVRGSVVYSVLVWPSERSVEASFARRTRSQRIVVITVAEFVPVVAQLVKDAATADQVDILAFDQFMAVRWSSCRNRSELVAAATASVNCHNAVVKALNADPALELGLTVE